MYKTSIGKVTETDPWMKLWYKTEMAHLLSGESRGSSINGAGKMATMWKKMKSVPTSRHIQKTTLDGLSI